MFTFYNTINDISSGLHTFFGNIDYLLSKPTKNVLSYLIPSMINSESVVTADISSKLPYPIFSSNDDSNQKRIWRLFNNHNFDAQDFFDSSIAYVINNLKSLRHQKLIITVDHTITNNDFISLVLILRIGKQGIPIYYTCDKTKKYRNMHPDDIPNKQLFSKKVILETIDEVISLFDSLDIKIIFLGDRWFSNIYFLKHIQDKGHYFCVRAKVNSNVKLYIYDKKEGHEVVTLFSALKPQVYHTTYYENIPIGSIKFKCNISVARKICTDNPWVILSNLNPRYAIREYNKRFGSIETLFKNTKTNGFNLEKTRTKNLRAFNNLYGILLFTILWLTIIALDYIKNYNHVKHKLNIRFTEGRKRILSNFNLGLKIFHKVFCSGINYLIKYNLQLYL